MDQEANHHIFLALSGPRPGRESEFDDWYENHHLQDVVRLVPGFVRGRRFRAALHQAAAQPVPWPSLAIYDLETPDIRALHEAVRTQAPQFTPSKGVFEADHAAW